jgi:hypothetical protein
MAEKKKPKSLARRLFFWTLALFVVLFVALLLLSLGNPDQPFTYVLQ